MRLVLLCAACGALIGFGGGYVAFAPHERVMACSSHTTGRIDLSTGKLARETACVTR